MFRTELDAWFVLQLGFFTTLHFLINTWLLTFVIALQQGLRPTAIWWPHFREVLLNYAAGGSIAALLVYNSREVKLEFILAILPLLIVLFLTYQWSNQRIEAEDPEIQNSTESSSRPLKHSRSRSTLRIKSLTDISVAFSATPSLLQLHSASENKGTLTRSELPPFCTTQASLPFLNTS